MSAGRYVAFDTHWSDKQGPQGSLDDGIAKGDYPAGTKLADWSMNRSANGDSRHVIGLQFPNARAAQGWIVEQGLIWGEDTDQFHRFPTKRELEGYLNDTSMATYLGLQNPRSG